jgi:translation initiation factor IF-1
MSEDFEQEMRDLARETEREARRAERDAEREARRAAREAERETRREVHRAHRMKLLGGHLTIDTDDREETEELERRFTVEGMPRIRVRNVSGDTSVVVGNAGEVVVRARKRVRGWSEDRAKRLLENVEIRMEQRGDEIVVEPTLYQQERGWMDLFRGGRATVDIEITVPKEAQIEATTVSGPLSVTGTRGPLETRTVSGRIEITDVQGPLRLRTVSGDLRASGYAGQAEANAVSGDMRFMRSRIKRPDIVSVSGDIEIEGALVGTKDEGEGRIKTVSGDIELLLAEEALELDFHSLSGDVEVDAFRAKVEKRGRREWHVEIGQGGPRIRAKTVSGDLTIRRSGEDRPAEAEAQSEEPMPMAAPAAAPGADVRELLQRVARGEMSVEDAASALDAGR